MRKLNCPCGYVHDLSPNPDEGWITIRAADYVAVIDALIRKHEIAGHGLPSDKDPKKGRWKEAAMTVFELSGRFYECPECRRIMWQRPDRGDHEILVPE